ncbi:MAG: glycosyltransferase family 39 protein [Bacteroidetes bacterium]|nr:glycosyltransferase family 39 protein [Bacteroidota bacterium]
MSILKRFFQNRPAILFILILAFILRLSLFIGIILKNPDGIYVYDSYGYWQIGYNIIHHFTFSQSYYLPLEPDYFRTPLYPLFIVLAESIGPEGFSIIVLQLFLSVGTCYFTYRIAEEITEKKIIANIAALIVAIDLPSIALSNFVLTETLFSFMLGISFYFFIRFLKDTKTKHLLYVGLFSGLSILCRPIAFFIPFFFACFIILKHKKLIRLLIKQIILLIGITFLTISPWLIRNNAVYGHYFLSVIREHNLLNYQAASVYAERFNYSLPKAQSILRWKTFREFKGNANKQPYEYAQLLEKESIKIIFEYPGIFAKQQLKGFIYFFLKPTRAYIEIQLGHWGKGYNTIPKDYPIFKYLFEHTSRLTIVLVFFQLFVLAVVYLSCIAGIMYLKKRTGVLYILLLVLAIFIFANFNLTLITESRFRVPVWSLVATISACGIYSIREKICAKKKTADLF